MKRGNVRERRYNLDLGRHLNVCDGNYLRLTKLMPNLGRHAEDAGSTGDRRAFRVLVGAASPAIIIEVVECSRYTTMLALSQLASGPGIADLTMRVRLYHDARSAEVIEFQGKRSFQSAYVYPNPEMRQPDEKAQLNRFLAEFLNEPFVSVLAVTNATVEYYARIFTALRRAGTPIPINDVWIAAVTMECNGHLLTFDRDYLRIGELDHTLLEVA